MIPIALPIWTPYISVKGWYIDWGVVRCKVRLVRFIETLLIKWSAIGIFQNNFDEVIFFFFRHNAIQFSERPSLFSDDQNWRSLLMALKWKLSLWKYQLQKLLRKIRFGKRFNLKTFLLLALLKILLVGIFFLYKWNFVCSNYPIHNIVGEWDNKTFDKNNAKKWFSKGRVLWSSLIYICSLYSNS